ncbi:MAG TPA: c-type cytochrome [Thermoanaerobaculia bacterium]|nr:c-type cytochrome [Thermoanaerobaculia bacterium]
MKSRSVIFSLILNTLRVVPVFWIAFSALPIHADYQPAVIFNGRCSGCHSVGHGVVVGPDLAGVTQRHSKDWLHHFIRSSQTVIKSGDPEAKALFDKFHTVMPDHDLADAEIEALLALIEAGGPKEPVPPELRLASEATPEEIAAGRALFEGKAHFASGAVACSHCHVAGQAAWTQGGWLASDLTHTYARLGDWGLVKLFRQRMLTLKGHACTGKPLTGEELFALKAWLRQTSSEPSTSSRTPLDPMVAGAAGGAGLVLLLRRRARSNRSAEGGS